MATARKKAAAPARAASARGTGVGRGEARGAGKPIKVRATRLGYYNDERKRIGDVFTISGDRFTSGKKVGKLKEFSDVWMEHVDPNVPERTTTAQVALNRETHRVAQEKAGSHKPEDNGGTGPTGTGEVL